MILTGLILLLFLAPAVLGQVYDARIVGHTPDYERILLPKGTLLRPPTLRGVDDLKPAELYPGTNRIDRIFADTSRERTNAFFTSCLSEVPISELSLQCPGGLLRPIEVTELLRDTVAVPRSTWTNHVGHTFDGRYVFSLVGSKDVDYVIDERAGACAVVFFPDGTYRCVMSPNWNSVEAAKQAAAAKRNPPISSNSNQMLPAPSLRH